MTLRYRSTATGLLLHKFHQDAQRTHHLTQARRASTSAQLQAPSTSSSDVIQALINAAPGCYPGDDGSSDVADRYNFFAHRKRFLFSPCSLGVFHENSRFRQAVIWCITWKRFDQFILFLILANSTILAIADYSKVDEQGDLDGSQSIRNAIVTSADSIFTILFAIECTMKIVAMGLFGEQGAYLMDPWNWMDFIVISIGILAVIPGIPNVSILRIFRVLRPLRSLNAVAGMKKLVSALLKSIPELLTVVAFLCFLFFLSDIMYMLQDAGYGAVAVIYFVSFIIFGSFFMLNLTLAVIWDNFSEASFLEAEERKALKKTFANQFRFDEYGFPVDRNQAVVYIPRSNFDTMLWSAVTVFQAKTGTS
ncbi:hypothetical protein PRNP1_008784 [Phytophthora ramorum]